MTDSHSDEDLEIRILRELTEIKLAMQMIKSDMDNSEMRMETAIVKHKSDCWRCNEFVKNTEFEHKIDLYLINKQKRFILMTEVLKSILYAAGTAAAFLYLKK